ncbi:GRB10-interacting GYF protein 2 isoform X2 [Megalops cyprinoides]|uniref:GRB10-interacting GYF protein 2 isoform X2 n=1 Tax=Megalops cyprinoides TaxID=118141 RepID=UPI001863FBAD|nr:GRB10-interacting GYF protein 2 isoform X2 [Megalops cyprinoides]
MKIEFHRTMAETQTLNFGPEWLRALSSGGGSSSVTSPPLSPALPKYKLADYRYGREEMLALYIKDNKIPLDLHDKEFLPILQEEPLPPLALVPFTEEEQRNFSMSVNSAAVLRLTGRGGGTVAGAPRGRSSTRGRGRGRGDGFYQRSFDDVEGGFGRGGREMHRSQSWEERGDRRFEKPSRKDPVDGAPAHFQLNHIRANYDEGGPAGGRKHEFTRSESENWRMSREEQNGEDDEGGWRLAGSRRDGDRWCPPSPDGPRSAGWDQRRRFPFDSREDERGYRRTRSGSGSLEDERDSLPEWCLEDAEEETGTFDSSGAFLSLKKAPKEPILEEAELDFRPVEEGEAHGEPDETKEADGPAGTEADRREDSAKSEEEARPPPSSSPCPAEPEPQPQRPTPSPPRQAEREDTPPAPEMQAEPAQAPPPAAIPVSLVEGTQLPHVPSTLPEVSAPSLTAQLRRPPDVPALVSEPLPFPAGLAAPISQPEAVPHDTDDYEGLKHLEQEAEKMVAYLQEDDRLSAQSLERAKPTALPLTHEAALKWFYKDPQGEIQGPFSNQEMMEWFQAGYFTMTLLVKRGCDELFQPLGEIMKMWGRVPFTPGPSLPPLLGDVDQERLKRQQELTALNLYQLQQLQYQYILRQQYAQALAQQQKAAALGAPQQQHQQQISLLLQQYQALKMRASEPGLVPPVTRSMSVPDSGSVWELQNPSTQAPGTANVQHVARNAWEGGSVWDLPGDPVPPAPTLEQIQQLEKAKAAAKLEQERREAELRAKREEEERKRQEEALLAQQEEERKRREEEELARRQQEEALRRQKEQEEALRRKKEEEEEEARRQEERKRREEEERRQREELLRKQEEERRKQEEMEAQRRLEEEKRLEEEARQQQEEQKKREQELQRQRQQEALRRLQQQQQLAQMKLPSSSKWGQQSAALCQTQNTLSLAEIQKLEEEREQQAHEERRQQQQELMKVLHQQQQQQQVLQQQQQQQARLPGWGSVARQPPGTPKSLLEIQREEAQQMKQRKEQQQSSGTQQNRPQNRTSNISHSVWGSVSNSSPQWGGDTGSIWGSSGDASNANMGFWDEAVKEAAPPPSRKSNAKNNKSNANLSHSSSGRANKKVEEEEKLLKLFQGANKSQDGFTQWCEQTLHTLNTANNLDVPTFASFLKEVDSPYEVHDYVRAYLGDTPEAKEFAKHFLERRAKQNANHQKPQSQPQLSRQGAQQKQQQQDSTWGGSQQGNQTIFQSNHNSLQQGRFETVTSGKKKKKQKMVRADPSLLGFSVNASSERLNMGEIETVEDF